MFDVMAHMKPIEYLVFLMPLLPAVALAVLGGRRLAELFLKSVSFGWRPTTSYLSGRHRKKEQGTHSNALARSGRPTASRAGSERARTEVR